MKLEDIVDSYDLKARVAPAAISFLPILFTAYYRVPSLYRSPFLAAGSGLISLALVYLCSMIIRYLGLREQDRLWKSWGGPPSTRFVRHRDMQFSAEQKKRIRTALAELFRVELFTYEEEMKDPKKADQIISRAFLDVKEFLRQHQFSALVDKHNVEYGFSRNLYGGRFVFWAGAGIGLLLAGFVSGSGWTLNLGVVVNVILLFTWIPVSLFLMPNMLKRSADTYAERAWLTFLKIVDNESKNKLSPLQITAG